jgi:hypothetical protein
MFKAIASARQSKFVKTHNIIGRLERRSILKTSSGKKSDEGDGVVSVESATNEMAVSQQFVPVEHSQVHQHPESIFEVQRILLEHLVQYDRIRPREIPEIPVVRPAILPKQLSGNPVETAVGPGASQSDGTSLRR